MRPPPRPRGAARTLSLVLLLVLTAGAVARDDAAPPAPGPAAPTFQKGMTFVHGYRAANDLGSQATVASLEHLARKVNVEWIALNPFAYQRDVDRPGLRFGGDPRDEHLVQAIRQARQLGLKVMLKPHIWLRAQSEVAWRGTIAMQDEADWQAWFANYERFLLHYARIAASEQVEIFCVGVELATTVKEREADWRRLIGRVREIYHGPLTYAANWWGEYDEIAIWDELDYIGVNAFFPLSDNPAPSLEQLRAGARRIADEVELIHQLTGRPVLFTEVGYKSTRASTVRPWEWPRRHEPELDLELQALAYQAILEVFWERPWFAGMYWWKWFSDLDRGGHSHGGFTPRGKPAEQLLSEWYRRAAPTPVRR